MFYELTWPNSNFGDFSYGDPRWEDEFLPAEWADDVELESIICPTNPGHRGPGKRGDLKIVLVGPNVGDFVWTWPSECLITGRVLSLFREAGLTGFEARPVEIKETRDLHVPLDDLPTLWEIVAVGRGGDALPESGIRLIYEHPACGLKEYSSFSNGIRVDPERWDGSDFFTITGYPTLILLTQRVFDVIAANKLTNCALIPSYEVRWVSLTRPEDMEWRDYPKEGDSRGAR